MLVSNGLWRNGTWQQSITSPDSGSVSSIEVSDAPNPNIHVGWDGRIPKGTGSVYAGISQGSVPVQIGYTYTMSCYARGTGILEFMYGAASPYLASRVEVNHDGWKRYAFTFTASESQVSDGLARFYFRSRSLNGEASNIEFCGMKLETGNMATDWSLAPEDIESRMAAIETRLASLGV